MQPLDPDLDLLRRRDIDGDGALADDRALILRDLVALRQIGIEIILAVEDRAQVDLGLKAQSRAHRLGHAFLVNDREHAGHRGVDERDIAVRLIAEPGRGAGEQLRIRYDLDLDLHPDHDLEFAGRALHEFSGFHGGLISLPLAASNQLHLPHHSAPRWQSEASPEGGRTWARRNAVSNIMSLIL